MDADQSPSQEEPSSRRQRAVDRDVGLKSSCLAADHADSHDCLIVPAPEPESDARRVVPDRRYRQHELVGWLERAVDVLVAHEAGDGLAYRAAHLLEHLGRIEVFVVVDAPADRDRAEGEPRARPTTTLSCRSLLSHASITSPVAPGKGA